MSRNFRRTSRARSREMVPRGAFRGDGARPAPGRPGDLIKVTGDARGGSRERVIPRSTAPCHPKAARGDEPDGR
jgi:hypothetical protein